MGRSLFNRFHEYPHLQEGTVKTLMRFVTSYSCLPPTNQSHDLPFGDADYNVAANGASFCCRTVVGGRHVASCHACLRPPGGDASDAIGR